MAIDFITRANELYDEMVARRRDLHRNPELPFQEIRTARIVAQQLTELGIEVRTGIGQTGVVGLLEGNKDGPTVLIRADMDALPIQEANETDYISQSSDVMHACGHDGHVTIGLAVAKLLAAHRDDISGRIKFVFQPAEEIGKGAAAMIADGVLQDPRPDITLGLHLWNESPLGNVLVGHGPVMAGADEWHCTVTGKGGHGASPHQTHDPVVAAAQIVNGIQTIMARNVPPLDSGVISVGSIHGGDAFNVIPDAVKLSGTIRSFFPETRQLLIERLGKICDSVAEAFECTAELSIGSMTLAVANDQDVSAHVRQVAATVVGDQHVLSDQRTMISEDVGLLMDDIPGCFFFVGSQNAARGLDFPHHSPRFDIDEAALPIGVAVLAGAAAHYLIEG